MKILVAGDWHSELHEEAVFKAFITLGHETVRFSWHEYFRLPEDSPFLNARLICRKIQNKFLTGPLIEKLNHDLIKVVREFAPELIFIYRGTHITKDTLQEIRECQPDAILVGYNNDDPYADGYTYWQWRHFIESIPEYHMVLAYRSHNLKDFRDAGARETHLLRSWYVKERNHPVCLSKDDLEKYGCDVVFIGHYENDGRLEMLEEVVRQGFHLRLYGPDYEWHPVLFKSPILRSLMPVRLVWGEEYNKALCGAKVALCFLSKLNRDTYTRRCFEIPASGALMLSEYTDDLATIYRAGIEADYFRDGRELIEKLKMYIGDEHRRRQVATAGHERVKTDGHDVVSRMQMVLDWVSDSKRQFCSAF